MPINPVTDDWDSPKVGYDRIPDGFDVTAVIGHVDFDGLPGDLTPHEAAFLLIARHDARGTFNFPMQDGRTMSVTVDYPDRDNQ